ncbi:RNA helicase Mov10l1 isoform X2 [Gadus morhua]|uniref:RNA helicase n=1 Tax=Gadus morhua TaxID=8049 RepID=A0A8C5FCF6_GADMO|nr:RNA helicase Mov10l1 isoform X2 [Gadus morhua]
MLSTVQRVLAKLVSPIWRTVDSDQEDMSIGAGSEEVRHLRSSVVTQICLDYGMIDDVIYFTGAQVLGGILLRVGDTVDGIAVRDGANGGWKALRVEKTLDTWEGNGADSESDSMRLRPLIGTVTSFSGDSGLINQTTFFPRYSLREGYEPMKGDWVQAQYFVNPTQWASQAHSVAPLRYQRLDEVRVSSVYGRSGVVDDTVFFTLESLLLPSSYKPSPGDMVNLVMVESNQSFYSWRALCMAPCKLSWNGPNGNLLEAEIQSLLENKGSLVVSDFGDFGELELGEDRTMVVWIQNMGSETQRLKSCKLTGWDSSQQFSLVSDPCSPNEKAPSRPTAGQTSGPAAQPATDQVEPQGKGGDDKELGQGRGEAGLEGTGHDASGKDGTWKAGTGKAGQDSVSEEKQGKEVDIAPGKRLSVVVGCTAKNTGGCSELLLLHFPSFTIGRRLNVVVSRPEERLLQPSTPYASCDIRLAPDTTSRVVTVTAPYVPSRLTKRRLPNFLGSYPVPQAVRECVEAKRDVLVVQPCLGEVLAASNMRARFDMLLWLEELQAEGELKEFSITAAVLRKGVQYLHLDIPGLAEGRPSLFVGDRIALKEPQCNGVTTEYIALVNEIHEEEVSLRVNAELRQRYQGEPLDVEFTYNRITMRRCHHALEQARHFGRVLFPTEVILQASQWTGRWLEEPGKEESEVMMAEHHDKVSGVSVDMKSKATQTKGGGMPSKAVPTEGSFFNPLLNTSQREAVRRVLAGECRPTPYILFGPPGTGKTITLIEAVLQVYHFVPSSRVLVCTPSNSAADLVCVRLHHSGYLHVASLARINASCRQEESIPEVLRPYSKAGEDVRQAAFHRIVVTTCSSAGMLHHIGLQVGHFTHAFLDEAGQATEPEALIPLTLVSEKDGQIVLAGDPCQLGPVVKSNLATAFALGMSMLERLMANPLYCRAEWGYNPLMVTKLMYNYRSHEALLRLPSKLFYHGELCVRAPKSVVNSLCDWKRLPTKGFPLLFHGIRGTEMREGANPSWFNPGEAVQAMLYCCQLVKRLYNPISPADIGIIAPYRKQSEKIRTLMGRVGLSDIKVGSVEEFQGQEFLVIILSTVRSNESVLGEDLQNILGFLSNPKRFNVAITRPKALLIIIGNPHILVKDLCFRTLLQYCFDNGAFIGCDPPSSLRSSRRNVDKDEKPEGNGPHEE